MLLGVLGLVAAILSVIVGSSDEELRMNALEANPANSTASVMLGKSSPIIPFSHTGTDAHIIPSVVLVSIHTPLTYCGRPPKKQKDCTDSTVGNSTAQQ